MICLNSVGLIDIAELVEIKSVCPSGGAPATATAASISDAPGLFSMITGLPRLCDSFSPYMRAITSMPVPAAKGTTIVMGRDG